jgi:predicted secreted protein
MDWFTGVVTYLLIWWVALFCVLPIGVQPSAEPDPDAGGWRGAPARPQLGRKLIGTTVLAAILWLGAFALMTSGWVSFREGWWAYEGPGVSTPVPGVVARPAQN